MLGIKAVGKKLFGSANDRIIKRHMITVEAINALEADFEALSDEALKAKTDEFRGRVKGGEELDDLLPEAFAVVREAAKRTLGQRHYDVQMVGGIVLHKGQISEMKTGEGKTLVSTLAAYLNALSGEGVHIVTVNDYLAQRDAEWMGQIYRFLGMSVGCIIPNLPADERRAAYAADIAYATNNELGFDYLRDNMAFRLEDMVQRPFNFAIVDEVDSILIDEARTPLIISGPTEDKSDMYISVDRVIRQLTEDDYEKDEKSKAITLSEDGTERIEGILKDAGLLQTDNLYDFENTAIVHHVNQALKAQKMFEADKDYIVKDQKVIIIDEFTGRMMEGRRYSDGLHQALEAKEGAEIHAENQTLASITFQNLFRMYPKLSGMTGTAATEAQEFADIYGLEVLEIPTNVPVTRLDEDDEFYRTGDEKFKAIVEDIRSCQELGQPVLVGTVSIEKSEVLSEILKKEKIKHNVLNARYHEQEAHIIAQAGCSGAVTIATNMAGRGTDIQLGGNRDMRVAVETADIEDGVKKKSAIARIEREIEDDKSTVIAAGGLYIMGTERHESRRIDNQLRGRAGRQGDPGRSKFYLSLHDDLMRIFGPERMDGMLVKLGIEEGEAIVHPWISKAIEKAQSRVESRNYDIRKNLLKYDNVMNDQRSVIYEQRKEIMAAEDVSDTILDMREDTIHSLVLAHIPPKTYADQWDVQGLGVEIKRVFGLDLPLTEWAAEEGVEETAIIERTTAAVDALMNGRTEQYGADLWKTIEKSLLLQVLDGQWKDHLSILEQLRQVVGLRAYAQRDPLNEYKTEAFTMFESLLERIRGQVCELLSHVQINVERAPEQLAPEEQEMHTRHVDPMTGENDAAPAVPPMIPVAGGLARNAPCPCGSGKKYKHCHGQDVSSGAPETWGKVSRNAPCPCGSGKKYKHCHGKA